jgi:polyisoprenoid-binding protein YceI
MKTKKNLLLIIALLAGGFSAFGQVTYKAQTSKLSVTGSSTLHEWTSEVTQVDWTGLIILNDDQQIETRNVVITIPVKSIKSTHGKMMDNKTYEAFKHDKNPNIVYKVTGTQKKGGGNETVTETSGTLTMAGVTKPLSLQVKSKTLSNGNLVITASRKLKMTEFNMDPPTAMMGTINVGEEVTVNLEITLTPNKI